MSLSRHEMVEAAEDLLTIIEADMVPVFSAQRVERLRTTPHGQRSAPWEVQSMADHVARLASKTIGGSAGQWRVAALAALGFRDREDVCVEVLRELAERVRGEQEQCEPASRRRKGAAEPSSKRDCPIRSTLGNRNRKRGGR